MNATRLAYLTIYPGNTMLKISGKHPLGYMPHTWTYYVVGVGENLAQTKWGAATWTDTGSSSDTWTKQHPGSTIHYLSGSTEAKNIHPDLRLSNGEVKIITECSLYNPINDPRRTFNFLLFTPVPGDSIKQNWFRGIAIFAPVTGSFSEKPPQ